MSQPAITNITNRQSRVRIPRTLVVRLARSLVKKQDVSIVFVGRAEMRKLNRTFLKHDYVTDVLAFPMGDGLLGEIIVCPEVAAKEARGRKIPMREELLRYVAHGILHLLGYDDHTHRDRERMWKRQERELRRLLKPHGS